MIRGVAFLGTAVVQFVEGRPVKAHSLWTSPDTAPVEVNISTTRDSIVVESAKRSAYPKPPGPWAVADYGMEDLAVPVLQALSEGAQPWQVLAYRPYAGKWDLITVTKQDTAGVTIYRLKNAQGATDWFLIGASGALIRMRRSGQRFERRPLEETTLWEEYRRLQPLDGP
jgi:hypothetical protein